MDSTPKISRDEYIRQMRQEIEETLGRVADAINEAPPGTSSRPVKRRSATSSRAYARRLMRRPCRCESMRRKPLSPLRRTRRRAGPSGIRAGRTSPC